MRKHIYTVYYHVDVFEQSYVRDTRVEATRFGAETDITRIGPNSPISPSSEGVGEGGTYREYSSARAGMEREGGA